MTQEHAAPGAPGGTSEDQNASEEPGTSEEEAHEAPVVVSPAIREVFELVRRLGKFSRIPVLIYGETGSGKEVVARELHANSSRRKRKLITVNCAAIPDTLMESTLFGHEPGAFTDAQGRRKGVFEAADKSAVFLDEIGELAPATQAALLRVLETGTITRIGSTTEVPVDVTVIAATNRSLEQMCDAGLFRKDLYFRLSGFVLTVPPLRERPEDVRPLVVRFLKRLRTVDRVNVDHVDEAAYALLRSYHWPGNIRELRNVIQRAAILADLHGRHVITADDLPIMAHSAKTSGDTASDNAQQPAGRSEGHVLGPYFDPNDGLKGALRRCEADTIERALALSSGDTSKTAQLLGINLRTLQHRMKQLGLSRGRASRS